MERPAKIITSALLLNALFFGLAIAQQVNRSNIVDGPVEDDLYFVGSALFFGTTLPAQLDNATGSSTYKLEGAGSVTIGSQQNGGFPRITLYGGTTITSSRDHGVSDVNHEWWEGEFLAPQTGNGNINVDGTDSPHGDDIARYIVEKVFEFGDGNETFSFSPAATLVADVGLAVSNDVPLYVAYRDNQDSESYVLDSADKCWVLDGYCVVDIAKANSIALVREVFEKCPARAQVPNGVITGVPNCILQCDNGYEPDDAHRYCVKSTGGGDLGGDLGGGDDLGGDDLGGDDLFGSAPVFQSDVVYPPGYFKYRETRAGFGRQIDTEGLSGEEKRRAEKLNLAKREVKGSSGGKTAEQVKIEQQEKDNFLNYMLALRGSGNEESLAYAEEAGGEEGEMMNGGDGGEETYGSAPLLPSTGPAMFWVLAAAGLGMMAFAARNKN